jgi:outer membrane protein OmpA-like peptidoglycan-associated protein
MKPLIIFPQSVVFFKVFVLLGHLKSKLFTKQNQSIMKHLFTAFCLALALILVQQEAFAQPKHGLTVRALWYNYENPQPEWEDWDDIFDSNGRGIELAYNRMLDKHATLVFPFKIGTANVPSERNNGVPGRNELLMNLDAHIQYSFCKYGKLINPYALLGVGSTWNVDDEAFDFNIPAGLGLNVRVARNLFVNAQTQYRFSIDDRPGWHHGIGATFFFDSDRDKDGISDEDDKCPDVPGLAATMGCPDRDGDLIADAEDQCPDVAGLAAFAGCPDRDSDGIPDKDDRCPTDAGTAANGGCPDRDGDTVVDVDDACPDQAGLPTFRGCPDTDGDGLPDKDDKCPTERGTVANLGCPVRDRDNDGIVDADDACPDQAGPAAMRGCPDRDNDGVADRDDRCPDKAGPASNKGCPEVAPEAKATLERAVKRVQFQTGKATLLASSFAVLDEVVSVMNQYPEYSLDISGHTDNVGDDKLNQNLSERRAKTCHDYLVSKGIATTRMHYAGYGETKPKVSNDTAAGRAENRRVVFDLFIK